MCPPLGHSSTKLSLHQTTLREPVVPQWRTLRFGARPMDSAEQVVTAFEELVKSDLDPKIMDRADDELEKALKDLDKADRFGGEAGFGGRTEISLSCASKCGTAK
jgi:hypothetical protein